MLSLAPHESTPSGKLVLGGIVQFARGIRKGLGAVLTHSADTEERRLKDIQASTARKPFETDIMNGRLVSKIGEVRKLNNPESGEDSTFYAPPAASSQGSMFGALEALGKSHLSPAWNWLGASCY